MSGQRSDRSAPQGAAAEAAAEMVSDGMIVGLGTGSLTVFALEALACDSPARLIERLRAIVGVVETGLFIGRADPVFVAGGDRVHHLDSPRVAYLLGTRPVDVLVLNASTWVANEEKVFHRSADHRGAERGGGH